MTLIAVGTAIWFWRQTEKYVERLFGLAERKFALEESKFTLEESKITTAAVERKQERAQPPEPPPTDLIEAALGEATTWAQEDALRRLYELRAELGSWDAARGAWINESVRSNYGGR